jgi:hypothetical protein
MAERSTRVAELSCGTGHVGGSEVMVDIESTVSFEVSFIGPEGFSKVSVDSILPFPFDNFPLTFVISAEEPNGNGISGEIEREPKLDRKPSVKHKKKNITFNSSRDLWDLWFSFYNTINH